MKQLFTLFIFAKSIFAFAQEDPDASKVGLFLNFNENINNAIENETVFSSVLIDGIGETAVPAVYTEGKFGKAIAFDGTYCLLAPDTTDYIRGDFTIAYYFKMTELSSVREANIIMVHQRQGEPSGIGRTFGSFVSDNDKFQVYYGDRAIYEVVPELNVWYHCAIVIDRASSTKKVYIDGNEIASVTLNSVETNNGGWVIGTSKTLDDGVAFKGAIDDFVITREALNFMQVATLAQTGYADLYAVGVKEVGISNLNVYHSGNRINIKSGQSYSNAKVNVYTLSGKSILNKGMNIMPGNNTLDIHLNRGMYLVRVECNGQSYANKVLVK